MKFARNVPASTMLFGAAIGRSMKHLVQAACAAVLLGAPSYAYAANSGINYDPGHNGSYRNAQATYNLTAMKNAINGELIEIKNMGFTLIKTYYPQWCVAAGECVTAADLAAAIQMRVEIGIYEWSAADGCGTLCRTWTQEELDGAVSSTIRNPGVVVGIFVGNEDMFTYNNGVETPNVAMQQQIVADIQYIRNKLIPVTGPNFQITSSQTLEAWQSLASSDPYGVLSSVNAVAVTLYPFWGGVPEKFQNGSSQATSIPPVVSTLSSLVGKPVIVAEEGWPSCGNNPGTQDATVAAEADYFNAWRQRVDTFDSYYYSSYNTYSKTNDVCPIVNNAIPVDAHTHFGLCNAADQTKSTSIITCTHP